MPGKIFLLLARVPADEHAAAHRAAEVSGESVSATIRRLVLARAHQILDAEGAQPTEPQAPS